jgi:hypothetical protein
MASSSELLKRVRGTRSVNIAITLSLTALLVAVLLPGIILHGVSRTPIVFVSIALLFVARSFGTGTFVGESSIRFVAFFSVRTIKMSEIHRIDIVGYSGMLNRFSAAAWDPLHRYLRMPMVTRVDGSRRQYAGVVLGREVASKWLLLVNAELQRSNDEN